MPMPTFLRNLIHRLDEKKRALFPVPRDPTVEADLNVLLEESDLLTGGRRMVSIQTLQKTTSFSKKQLQTLYRGMKNECPSGYIDKETFMDILGEFYPLGDAEKYASHVFRTFKPDDRGRVCFQQLIETLSMLMYDPEGEGRLFWLFTLYDVDNDGLITLYEVEEIVESVYDLIQHYVPHHNDTSPRERAYEVYKKLIDACADDTSGGELGMTMMTSGDGRCHQVDGQCLTWELFRAACRNNPQIVNSLDAFNTVIPVH